MIYLTKNIKYCSKCSAPSVFNLIVQIPRDKINSLPRFEDCASCDYIREVEFQTASFTDYKVAKRSLEFDIQYIEKEIERLSNFEDEDFHALGKEAKDSIRADYAAKIAMCEEKLKGFKQKLKALVCTPDQE